MNSRGTVVALIAIAIIAFVGWFSPKGGQTIVEQMVGGVTNFDSLEAGTLAIGSGCDNEGSTCTGTSMTRINAGTCYIRPLAATIAATSTAMVECQGAANIKNGVTALTGVAEGDAIMVALSTTTATGVSAGLVVSGVSASNTQGYIMVQIENQTGDVYTWPQTGTASGTARFIAVDF